MDALLVKLASMEDKLDLQVKAWRNQVRELSYDTEDNIDLFMHKLCRVDAKASFVQKTTCKIRNVMMRRQIIKKIHQLKARVKEESDRCLRYNFDQYDAHVGIIEIDLRLPVLYVEATRLVGIDGPMETVIDLLMTENNSAQQPNVVSIVGFGGLGKTTLANQVYHKLKGQFDCTAFVPVSRNPNTKKILFDMLNEIGIRAIPDNERQIIYILREYLQNRRYFVVVDDIWSTAAWEQLKSALPENSLCSKILTTSRNSDVARSCCFGFPRNIYEIQPLNEQDSKVLFFKRVFHSKIYCPPHLEQVSQAIIKRCCGLPLAIISIASLLASKSNAKEQWDQVRSLNFFGPAKQIPYLSKFYSLRLKYLRIGCTSITKLPEDIADLQYLQTLDICRSKIERLPSSIGRLQRLICLLVGSLVELPDEIGDLKALEVLSHANYYNSTKFVGGLKRLTNMKSLTIDLHDVDMLGNDGMGKYHKADKLMDLLCCTVPYLQKLVIDGDGITRLSRWLSSFVNLTHLDICILSICKADLGLVGSIPVLLYLSMEVIQAPNDKLAINSAGFKCLKEFEFACRWGGGLGLVCEPGSMPMLLRLQIELGAEETVSKMGFEFSFKNLSNLEHLTARISCLGATRSRVEAAEAAIRSAIAGHSGRPTLEIQRKFEHSMEMDKEGTRVSEEDLQPQPDLPYFLHSTPFSTREYPAKIRELISRRQQLTDELTAMNNFLIKMSNMEENLGEQEEWRNRVRELSYDIEDCIDLFMRKFNHGDVDANIVRRTAKKIRMLWSRHEIASQIHQLKDRVNEESACRLRYRFGESNARIVEIDPRLPALYVEAEKLVGIHGPMEKIIDLLTKQDGSSQQLKVVSVLGFGGLGKTTLANQVFKKIKHQFDCTALVSVSRSPDIKKILFVLLKDMINENNSNDEKHKKVVGIKAEKSDDEKQLINKLREYLTVVVDDIWSASAWEHVKLAFPDNNLCSRIIATMRNANVAKSCCSGFQHYIYNIQTLDEQDSYKLFLKRLSHTESDFPSHLGELSHAITKKCHGLPLAIICVASLLANKPETKDQWEHVHNSISSAFSSQIMKDILLLSYYDLPYHLKTCLLYLSIFPEDYWISKVDLLLRWIAEGFIPEVKDQALYQVAENYFNELINRSMIQPVNIDYDGSANACRMHDVMLELIVSLSEDENFNTLVDGKVYKCSSSNIRRLSLQSSCVENDVMQDLMNKCSHIRSLSFFRENKETPHLPKFRYLRVLVFEDCDSLGNQHIKYLRFFCQLKYLRINSEGITELPDKIGDLKNLQTLDIHGSKIGKLPAAIGRLQNLLYLHVNSDVELPDEVGDLQALQVLSDAFSYNPIKFVEELRRLTKLRSLHIGLHSSLKLCYHDMRRYEEALKSSLTVLGKHSLRSLVISRADCLGDYLMDLLCDTVPCLQVLVMYGPWNGMLSERIASLDNLSFLAICVRSIKQKDLWVLGGLPSLLKLELHLLYGPDERLIISSQLFQCLKKFKLKYELGGGLSMVCEREAMPKLQMLHLRFKAMETKSNTGFELRLEHLSSLRHLSVTVDCDDATRRRVEAAEATIRNTVRIHP
uniref:NB-ARC domain-containing protein n=1 Tax=Oryza meridionalis TaxID=40149 RepID=A0A0E0FB55_9ORYZ